MALPGGQLLDLEIQRIDCRNLMDPFQKPLLKVCAQFLFNRRGHHVHQYSTDYPSDLPIRLWYPEAMSTWKVLPLILPVLLLAGCASGPSRPSDTSPMPQDHSIRFSSSKHQLFLQKLFEDCMTLANDTDNLSTDPDSAQQKVEGYCLCFRMMFREKFTEPELDAYLEQDKPLDENRLDDIAAACSIHLEGE